MKHHDFDEKDWIARLGAVLETIAPTARPQIPDPAGYTRLISFEQYRELGHRAKDDPGVRKIFEDSHLWFDSDSIEATAVLREHPLVERGLTGPDSDPVLGFVLFTRSFHADLNWLVSNLTKHAVKESGERAAESLHRYLTLGEAGNLPATEIILFYGLTMDSRVDLGSGAFLAPYDDLKADYGLPADPDARSFETRESSDGFQPTADVSVLVRGMTWGPGVAPQHPADLFGTPRAVDYRVRFRFPDDYEIVLDEHIFPSDYSILMELLSIAARSPLLSRTRFVRVAKWIEEIDPNFAFGAEDSGGFLSDRPPRGLPLTAEHVAVFARLSKGWRRYGGKQDPMHLAIHRLAASFSRPGNRFSTEDRVLDTAIALEILYGLRPPGLTYKLSTRAVWLLDGSAEERKETLATVKSFYRARSSIIHGDTFKGGPDALHAALIAGRDIACRTLLELLQRKEPIKRDDWEALVVAVKPSPASATQQEPTAL